MTGTVERTTAAVRVRGLQVLRGTAEQRRTVLDDVSFTVGPGEVVGVVGRRGAGTSTLLGALAGRLPAHRGDITVLGTHPARDGGALAALPSRGALFEHLTVTESVRLWAALRSTHRDAHRDADEVVALCGLTAHRRTPVRRLGAGEHQRLQLAVTFVGAAPVVLCDEPAGGSAPGTVAALTTLARRHREEGGTVLTGSSPEDLDPALVASWDRVAVLRRGRLVAYAGPAELVDRFVPHGAATVLLADAGEARALSSAAPGATFRREGTLVRVDVPDCSAARTAALTAGLASVREVVHHDGTLVDAVRRATADRRAPWPRETA